MKVYTRSGDDGTTGLFGGKRVSKSDIRIEAYGTVDELNAHIGLVADFEVNAGRREFLVRIQDRLFTIGAMLATVPGNSKVKTPVLHDADAVALENEIDRISELLPALRAFILPGGHVMVSHAHIARTVCRRAERIIVSLSASEPVEQSVIIYLNRLSDYLFVLSRVMAKELNCEDREWKPEL